MFDVLTNLAATLYYKLYCNVVNGTSGPTQCANMKTGDFVVDQTVPRHMSSLPTAGGEGATRRRRPGLQHHAMRAGGRQVGRAHCGQNDGEDR
jgi:hypothetical protein